MSLHADASAAAGRRADELRAELEAARVQFAEALERLVAQAEALRAAGASV